jgi:hypothetical protein
MTSLTTWYGNQRYTTGTTHPHHTHARRRAWCDAGWIVVALCQARVNHTQVATQHISAIARTNTAVASYSV